jgi:hypothetical protein
MKFTIVFPTHESTDLSLAAVFASCLTWMEGAHRISNPHPHTPHYQLGDLQEVLRTEKLEERLSDTSRKVTVVCHPTGHGTEEYLKDILADLQSMGFEPILVRH